MKLTWLKSDRPRRTKVPVEGRIADEPFAPERSSGLVSYPPPEQWDHWVEYESTAWPRKVERAYSLVPTICFNCEAACGLLAYYVFGLTDAIGLGEKPGMIFWILTGVLAACARLATPAGDPASPPAQLPRSVAGARLTVRRR